MKILSHKHGDHFHSEFTVHYYGYEMSEAQNKGLTPNTQTPLSQSLFNSAHYRWGWQAFATYTDALLPFILTR